VRTADPWVRSIVFAEQVAANRITAEIMRKVWASGPPPEKEQNSK